MKANYFPLFMVALAGIAAAAEPIRLHPDNPHYFQFRGRPTVLVTGAEHYGAVLNLDFNYVRYLNELGSKGLNFTRIFTGAYYEVPKNFGIAGNTLAPAPGRFISPWREVSPGKFDLNVWNPAYFRRLRDFVKHAGRRGVVVELSLFCPYYEDSMWEVSPLNVKNNVNGAGDLKRTQALTLDNGKLLAIQDAMVRKIVAELKSFDNLFYEICNEPYFGGVTLEWQRHISETIAAAEAPLRGKHLIAQNIANNSAKVENPNPLISLFNFHYARPPQAVAVNYHLNKAIGYDETGFDGTADSTYRVQAWDFLIAGGATYNHLDYSFSAGHEDGSFEYPATQPGGGSSELRRQFGILKRFMESLPFLLMQPEPDVIVSGVPEGASARALGERGRNYAIYIHHGKLVKDAKPRYQVDESHQSAVLTLNLGPGTWRAEWINPKTGAVEKTEDAAGGKITSPEYGEDIAVRLTAR